MLWLIVFALAPCTVKEAWVSVAGLDYAKPLNKAKTTTSAQQCQYSHLGRQRITVEQKIQVGRKFLSNPLVCQTNDKAAPACLSLHSIYFRANNPPFYILYKRLKLDIV